MLGVWGLRSGGCLGTAGGHLWEGPSTGMRGSLFQRTYGVYDAGVPLRPLTYLDIL